MKKFNNLFFKMMGMASALVFFQGCTEPKSMDSPTIETLTCDTTVFLKENIKSSPSCKIDFSLDFLKSCQDSDSTVYNTNKMLVRSIEEGIPPIHTPEDFIQQLRDTLIFNYRQYLDKLYEYDLRNGMKDHELPGWYNYEYNISAKLAQGQEHIWNYRISHYSYTGGAHPNSYQKWINITDQGKLLTKEDVFLPNTDAAVCELILKELIRTANERMETDTITGIQGLQEYGILQMNGLYIPDNFLLEKEGIRFLYNPYDIAPYAVGSFELEVPYQELNTYLIKH